MKAINGRRVSATDGDACVVIFMCKSALCLAARQYVHR